MSPCVETCSSLPVRLLGLLRLPGGDPPKGLGEQGCHPRHLPFLRASNQEWFFSRPHPGQLSSPSPVPWGHPAPTGRRRVKGLGGACREGQSGSPIISCLFSVLWHSGPQHCLPLGAPITRQTSQEWHSLELCNPSGHCYFRVVLLLVGPPEVSPTFPKRLQQATACDIRCLGVLSLPQCQAVNIEEGKTREGLREAHGLREIETKKEERRKGRKRGREGKKTSTAYPSMLQALSYKDHLYITV